MQFSAKVFLRHNINIILMEQLEYSLDPRLLNSNFIFFELTLTMPEYRNPLKRWRGAIGPSEKTTFHSKHQKTYQWTLGTQEPTPIGSYNRIL